MLAPARLTLRRAITVFGVGLSVLVATSCGDGDWRHRNANRHCDYVERRCHTVCDYWCDYYGCYPTCWDQCWDDCYVNDRTPGVGGRPVDPPAPTDAGPASSSSSGASGATSSSGSTGGTGNGVLCSACSANDDCEAGALCILRGGPPPASHTDGGAPGGTGFCGHGCQSGADCPTGFTCTQIGQNKQCLPNAGQCP